MVQIRKPRSKAKRVYVTATDARTRKSRCRTYEGLTPLQLLRLIDECVERKQREEREVKHPDEQRDAA